MRCDPEFSKRLPILLMLALLPVLSIVSGCRSYGTMYFANLKPGVPEHWYQDSVQYRSFPKLICIPQISYNDREEVGRLVDSLGLEDVTSSYLANRGPDRYEMILRKNDGTAFDRMSDSTLRTLRTRSIGAGPIVRLSDYSVTALANIIYLKPSYSSAHDSIRALMAEIGATELARVAGVMDIHYMVVDAGIGEGINDLVRRLVASGAVVYAYPGTFDPLSEPLD